MWFIYSYFITIIASLMLIILEIGIHPDNNPKLKDFYCLFLFFVPLLNYLLLMVLMVLVLLDVKNYYYEKLVEKIKKSLEVKE